jgi:hypothetical protein
VPNADGNGMEYNLLKFKTCKSLIRAIFLLKYVSNFFCFKYKNRVSGINIKNEKNKKINFISLK